jgi:hypothetical protein
MECPNCHFHNMPGNTRCLKCGGQLGLAKATISVEPPRASARSKRLRKWLPRWTHVLRPARLEEQAQEAAGRLNQARAPGSAIARAIVPGWGQWYLGNAARARNYFVPWLLLVVVGLLRWGWLLSSVALYAAICVHGVSIADLLMRPPRRTR